MSDDTFPVFEFTCPECGSHHFEQNEADGLLCHGQTDTGSCVFRCAADDPRYFRETGDRMPRTFTGQAFNPSSLLGDIQEGIINARVSRPIAMPMPRGEPRAIGIFTRRVPPPK